MVGKRCFLHKTLVTLWFYIGLILLLQCVTNAAGDADNATTEHSIATPDNLPLCASDFIGNEIRATTDNMIKYMDSCNHNESEYWRTTWFNVNAHSTGNAWHKKVCNFFLLQHCNGTHCVCGDRKTFGADLEYVSRSDEKQTCFAKDMEPCSRYHMTLKRSLAAPWEKKDAKVIQYLVPADAWGNKDCRAKINLDCATDGFWCQTVKEENKNLIFSTRCIRKEFGNGRSGQGEFHVSSELVLLFGMTLLQRFSVASGDVNFYGALASPLKPIICSSSFNEYIVNIELPVGNRYMLKHGDKCNRTVSEEWRSTWLTSTKHSFNPSWHHQVCNFYLLQQCNGSHCDCGDKATFGVELEYVPPTKNSFQTCFAKELESCSQYTEDFSGKFRGEEKRRAVIQQYLVPAEAWGSNCTPKVNLGCGNSSYWCKPVQEGTNENVISMATICSEVTLDSVPQQEFLDFYAHFLSRSAAAVFLWIIALGMDEYIYLLNILFSMQKNWCDGKAAAMELERKISKEIGSVVIFSHIQPLMPLILHLQGRYSRRYWPARVLQRKIYDSWPVVILYALNDLLYSYMGFFGTIIMAAVVELFIVVTNFCLLQLQLWERATTGTGKVWKILTRYRQLQIFNRIGNGEFSHTLMPAMVLGGMITQISALQRY
ncbi:hypothetical protein Ocin01_01838 [Orchesella cincta]|uniref:Uncharacterized protein n=1 Tax=Orchesella cincta TaxID=48709 RepID=A0A1D2NHW2_ORCCI|nr:hypothetical protein Ocin01_01838 [Orchesella cincta]